MAIEEMFTELPTVSTAQLTDIICAVQGFNAPSSIGLSVQETLQQVYNLFQSNLILFNAGNPNGVLAGTTYQLCWDSANGMLWVCTASGSSSTAVWSKAITLTAGLGISISQAGSTITISSTGDVPWVDQTTPSVTMTANVGYTSDAGASLVTFTLPISSAIGDSVEIVGKGSGGWTIAQASGQQIFVSPSNTTSGASGSLSSVNQYDCVKLRCLTANDSWTVVSQQSSGLTIV